MKMRTLLIALIVLGLNLGVQAQTSRGTVSGVISDSQGAVIAGATVTLTNDETGVARTTVTNSEGFYRFEAVDLGSHSVKFEAASFGPLTKTRIIVNANQVSTVNAQLEPGFNEIVVDVVDEAGAALQTETAVRGGNISTSQITELPIATRNPVAFALTLPGVSSNRFGFGVGTFSINGARGRSNNFLIDGMENNDISVAGQGFQITNPEAVKEVSVQTGNFDAEFGRSGGGVINTITRGGTNEFHGSLTYLLDSTRDDALTSSESRRPALSRDPSVNPNRDGRGHPPPGTEQWFAGTIGGPILRNRTFFFGAYQEQRQNSTGTIDLVVPTTAGHSLLSQLFPAGSNANLDTYRLATGGAVGQADPFNVAIGERSGCAAPCNVQFGTFTRTFGQKNILRQWMARIDHKLGDSDQLSGRFLFDDQNFPQGTEARFEGFDSPFIARLYNFLLTETHIFSPRFTNEARIGYNRIAYDFPLSSSSLAQTLPTINITLPISRLGHASNLPQGRTANNYVIQDTMTYVTGNHTFRFGFDLLEQRSKQFAPFRGRGELSFASSNVGGISFHGFANFLDNFGGSGGSALRDFGSPAYYPSLFRQAYFFQDRWRATPELTLTLGLRYEHFGNPINSLQTAAFTGLFNVDPVTLDGPYSQPNRVDSDNNNFAPVIGVAYSPSFSSGLLGWVFGVNRSVVRAGYQIGYDSFFNNIASNAASSSPNIVATTTSSVANAANPRGLANLTASFPTVPRPLSPFDAQVLVVQDLKNPYMQRWSLGMQRELPLDLIVDFSYVGSKGTHLYINEDMNPLVPLALRVTPPGYVGPTSGRFDNLQGSRLIRTNGGSSIYHAGQLDVRRRFGRGFLLTGAYTWSKLIDNASEVFGVAGNNLPQQAAQPPILGFSERLERSVSLFDRRHRASFTYLYQIPFFRSQEGFVGRVLGGWEVSGVTTFESGAPLTITNGVDADSIGGNLDRPDYNPFGQRGVRAVPNAGSPTGYVNPDANNAPIDPSTAEFIGLAAGSGRTGNLGRNTHLTPGTNNWNVNIMKKVKISENKRLEFRTEFFNIFNHPQYTQPSVSPFSPLGGTIPANVTSSVAGRFLNPNTPQSDGGGRVIRYQLKFTF